MRGGLGFGRRRAVRADSRLPESLRPRTRPDALLYMVAAALLAYMWRFQDIFPALAIVRPTTLLLLASLGLAAVTVHPRRALTRLRSPVIVQLGVMLTVVAVGVPFSLNPAETRHFLLSWLFPSALLAALVAVSVRDLDDLEWLGAATLVGGCLYAAIMLATRPQLDAEGRWTSLVFYDPNDLSLVLVGLIPLTLYFMRRGEPRGRRWLGALSFVFFVFLIVRTGSRGGFLGLAAVLAYVLVAYRALPTRARVGGALAAVLLLAAGGHRYWERVQTMLRPSADYNWSGEDYTGRGELWRRGVRYLRQRPLVGVGANAFTTAERDISPTARRRLMAGKPVQTLVAHNTIVQVGAELGIPGLIIFAVLLVQTAVTLRRLGRRYWADPQLGGLAQTLTGAWVGYVVCGLFLSAAYFTFLHMLLGFVAGTDEVARERSWLPPARVRRGGAALVPSPLQGTTVAGVPSVAAARAEPALRSARGPTSPR